jgi:hypothetical protein
MGIIFKKSSVVVSGVICLTNGERDTKREYFHVIKTVGEKKYALRTNGDWFLIGAGGGLPMDCAFVKGDGSADVWDR